MTLTVGPPQRVGALDAVLGDAARDPWQARRVRALLMDALGLRREDETPANSQTNEELATSVRLAMATARNADREVRDALRRAIVADPFLSCDKETPTTRMAEIVAGAHSDRVRSARYQALLVDRVQAKLLSALPDVRPIVVDGLAAVAATRIRDQARKIRALEEQLTDARATPTEIPYLDGAGRAVLTELIDAADRILAKPVRFSDEDRLIAAIAAARGLLR